MSTHDEPTTTATLTFTREDDTDITVLVGLFPLSVGGDIWSVIEAVDENGNEVDLTQWESTQAGVRARAGEDETGR